MSIKSEFEKEFKDNHKKDFPIHIEAIAKAWMLIGAKWAMEKCAKEVHSKAQPWAEGRIRQLSKELEEGGI